MPKRPLESNISYGKKEKLNINNLAKCIILELSRLNNKTDVSLDNFETLSNKLKHTLEFLDCIKKDNISDIMINKLLSKIDIKDNVEMKKSLDCFQTEIIKLKKYSSYYEEKINELTDDLKSSSKRLKTNEDKIKEQDKRIEVLENMIKSLANKKTYQRNKK